MSILGYLQKVGLALMLPVAVLPAAAMLMGIGYWIDPNGWGGDSQLAAFLIKAGKAVIENMSMLFAVGVAYGMSKDKDGAAALSGLVGWLILTTLLSPEAVTQITGHTAHVAFASVNNQFIGILVGLCTASLYNRFSEVELHHALAFFSGRRLVPILVAVAMIIMALLLMFLWPIIFANLQAFGEAIANQGDIGAGLYGFFNRLLIPVGLHHALNSVFWFDVAGINDIPHFLAGQQTITQFAEQGKQAIGHVGIYQAGFFPIMMFGLPGAALAIYMTAKKENQEKVASIMLAAALASFFTGVTEPLEFSFMFVAPLLYAVHALLTGLSVYIAAHMQWIAGFGFSAGFVDMALSSNNPLAKQWYMLVPQGCVFFGAYYFIFKSLILKFDLKTPGREGKPAFHISAPQKSNKTLVKNYIKALGGINNIVDIDACITRLRLTLINRSKIKEADMKALGAMGVVKLGESNLQVIIGPQAESIADTMKKVKSST